MDLQALSIFVGVIDSGNLSRAARSLKMSRGNVSYHLARLEKDLGAQLLHRTPQGVELTDMGQQVYAHARTIVQESVRMRELIDLRDDRLSGKVGITAPTGFGHLVMAPWLIEFKTRYPDVVLDVRLENFVDNLARDGVDIALRVTAEPPPMVVARDLGAVRYALCASRAWAQRHGLPQRLADLPRLPVITSNGQDGRVRVTATLGEHAEDVELAPTLTSRSYPFVLACVLGGVGLGLVPDYVVRPHLASGELVAAMPRHRFSFQASRLYLMYLPHRHQARATATLIDFLIAKIDASRALHDAGLPGS